MVRQSRRAGSIDGALASGAVGRMTKDAVENSSRRQDGTTGTVEVEDAVCTARQAAAVGGKRVEGGEGRRRDGDSAWMGIDRGQPGATPVGDAGKRDAGMAQAGKWVVAARLVGSVPGLGDTHEDEEEKMRWRLEKAIL